MSNLLCLSRSTSTPTVATTTNNNNNRITPRTTILQSTLHPTFESSKRIYSLKHFYETFCKQIETLTFNPTHQCQKGMDHDDDDEEHDNIDTCDMIPLNHYNDFYFCRENQQLHYCTKEHCDSKTRRNDSLIHNMFGDNICARTGINYGIDDFYHFQTAQAKCPGTFVDQDHMTSKEYQSISNPFQTNIPIPASLYRDSSLPIDIQKYHPQKKKRRRNQQQPFHKRSQSFPELLPPCLSTEEEQIEEHQQQQEEEEPETEPQQPPQQQPQQALAHKLQLYPIPTWISEQKTTWINLFHLTIRSFCYHTKILDQLTKEQIKQLTMMYFNAYEKICQTPLFHEQNKQYRFSTWYLMIVILEDSIHGGCLSFVEELNWFQSFMPQTSLLVEMGKICIHNKKQKTKLQQQQQQSSSPSSYIPFQYQTKLFNQNQRFFHYCVEQYNSILNITRLKNLHI